MKGLRVRIKHLEHIKGFLLYDKDSRKYIFEYDDGRKVDMKCDFNYTIFEYLPSPFFADNWLPLTWDDYNNLRK